MLTLLVNYCAQIPVNELEEFISTVLRELPPEQRDRWVSQNYDFEVFDFSVKRIKPHIKTDQQANKFYSALLMGHPVTMEKAIEIVEEVDRCERAYDQ